MTRFTFLVVAALGACLFGAFTDEALAQGLLGVPFQGGLISPLTYVRTIPEPGHNYQPAPVNPAMQQFNASVTRANQYLQQYQQINEQLLQARAHAYQQHNAQAMQRYYQQQQHGAQMTNHLMQLRQAEFNYQRQHPPVHRGHHGH